MIGLELKSNFNLIFLLQKALMYHNLSALALFFRAYVLLLICYISVYTLRRFVMILSAIKGMYESLD